MRPKHHRRVAVAGSVRSSPVHPASAACEPLEGRRLLAAIASGQRLTGPIALGQSAAFEFSLNAGDRFTFLAADANGGFFAPQLEVFAPNGTSIGTTSGATSAALDLTAGTTGLSPAATP